MNINLNLSTSNMRSFLCNGKLYPDHPSKLVIATRMGANGEEKYIDYRPLTRLEKFVNFFGIGNANLRNVINFACENGLFNSSWFNFRRFFTKAEKYNGRHLFKIDISKLIMASYGSPVEGLKAAINLEDSRLASCMIKHIKAQPKSEPRDTRFGTLDNGFRACLVNENYSESDNAKRGHFFTAKDRLKSKNRLARWEDAWNTYQNLRHVD